MKQKAVIGTFYDRLDNARVAAIEKNKEICPHKDCKESHFTIIQYGQGYIVVSNRFVSK